VLPSHTIVFCIGGPVDCQVLSSILLEFMCCRELIPPLPRRPCTRLYLCVFFTPTFTTLHTRARPFALRPCCHCVLVRLQLSAHGRTKKRDSSAREKKKKRVSSAREKKPRKQKPKLYEPNNLYCFSHTVSWLCAYAFLHVIALQAGSHMVFFKPASRLYF
jgi:hypothetical protein